MKQTCSWCGRDRKAKHFPSGSADCKDCIKQQKNQTLAGSNPNASSSTGGLPPHIAGMFGNAQVIGVGPGQGSQITFGPGGFMHPPKPSGPVPLSEKSEKVQERVQAKIEQLQEAVRAGFADADEVDAYIAAVTAGEKAKVPVIRHLTMGEASGIEKLELKLKYSMNDDGKPLTATERADLEQQITKLMFLPHSPVAEDDEAAAIASILGGSS